MPAKTHTPATNLVNALKGWVDGARPDDIEAIVPLDDIRQWLKWAKSIDARMRLDGSKRNKRKAKA